MAMITATLVCISALFGQGTRPTFDNQQIILTSEAPYILLPPVHVSSSTTGVAYWSPNGKYFAHSIGGLSYFPPYPNDETKIKRNLSKVLIFDTQTMQSKSIWSAPDENSAAIIHSWRFDSGELYFSVGVLAPIEGEPRRTFSSVYRASIPSGTTYLIKSADKPYTNFSVYSSPKLPITIISESIGNANRRLPADVHKTYLMDGYGRLLLANENIGSNTPSYSWTPDGHPAITLSTGESINYSPKRYLLTPDGLDELPFGMPTSSGIRQPSELEVESIDAILKSGNAITRTQQVWLKSKLESERMTVLVTADGFLGSLSPSWAGVVYLSNRSLFFKPLVKLDKSTYQNLLENYSARNEQQDCQAIAAAIFNWAMKNNKWPDGDLISTLGTQEISANAFAKFVYTKPDIPFDFPDKSKHQLGFIQGKLGRAVAYADGRVEWIKNQ